MCPSRTYSIATPKFFSRLMVGLADDQVISSELGRLLKLKNASQDALDRYQAVLKLLQATSSRFSLQHMSHDVFKFLCSTVEFGPDFEETVRGIVDLLVRKFQTSFRPSTKDVLDAVSTATDRAALWIIPDLLQLLNLSLRNSQGNPKNVYQYVTDSFLPLARRWSDDFVSANRTSIQSIIGMIFQANANITCLNGYLMSSPQYSEATEKSRKRKSDGNVQDSYVSHLFSETGSTAWIAELALTEYVQRLRQSTTTDSREDFLCFKKFLNQLDLAGQTRLWAHMSSELRMYRLRDETSGEHKQALREYFNSLALPGIDTALRWKGLETTLLVDPVNFTDLVLDETIRLLSSGESTDDSQSCLRAVFRTFAVKGSLSELLGRFLNASSEHNILASVDLKKSVFTSQLGNEISGMDLVTSLEVLISSASDCALWILGPLVIACMHRVPEHLLPKTSALLESGIDKIAKSRFLDAKKSDREYISKLMIVMIDGLRKVSLSHTLPFQQPPLDTIEGTLSMIAQKDSRSRAGALVRLALICSTDVSVAELLACYNASAHITEFISDNFVNAFAVVNKFKTDPDWEQLRSILPVTSTTFKSFPEELVGAEWYPKSVKRIDSMEMDEIDSLLGKSKMIIDKFPRLIFTPVNLRRSDFPDEILGIELAWSNQASRASDVLARLTGQESTLESVYGLIVMAEEARRNKTEFEYDSVSKIASNETVPLLARARALLAVPQTQREHLDMMVQVSTDLLAQDLRDKPCIDTAYFCSMQALMAGVDRRRIRIPWWASKMHIVMVALRGLIGSCISGTDQEAQKEAAFYVARVWKCIVDSVSSEKLFKISKSVAVIAGDYIRLSGKVTNAECAAILERGCCVLLDKLSDSEKNFLHAMLGKTDRETLKRIVDLLDKNFKYKGKA